MTKHDLTDTEKWDLAKKRFSATTFHKICDYCITSKLMIKDIVKNYESNRPRCEFEVDMLNNAIAKHKRHLKKFHNEEIRDD